MLDILQLVIQHCSENNLRGTRHMPGTVAHTEMTVCNMIMFQLSSVKCEIASMYYLYSCLMEGVKRGKCCLYWSHLFKRFYTVFQKFA